MNFSTKNVSINTHSPRLYFNAFSTSLKIDLKEGSQINEPFSGKQTSLICLYVSIEAWIDAWNLENSNKFAA